MAQARLGTDLARTLPGITLEKVAQVSLDRARENLPYSSRSILDLRPSLSQAKLESAIVICAGPSLHRRDVAQQIKDSDYTGLLIATESAMAYCLRNDLVPDVVVTVDPHAKRIVRWFGDLDLTQKDLDDDDYYRRQDLDPGLRKNEIIVNEELLSLVDKHGAKIKIAIATCASDAVVKRAIESGMEPFWWNPYLDDFDNSGSLTRELFSLNRLPCLNAGGNVGTACWVIGHSILGIPEIALTGMDLSYYDDTDYSETQYYYELLDLVGEENLDEVFSHIENPYLGRTWFTDPTYYWYRDIFLEMAPDAPCRTLNCTEGGILFGEGVEFVPLNDFLVTHSNTPELVEI
jgi:hypothetical protein